MDARKEPAPAPRPGPSSRAVPLLIGLAMLSAPSAWAIARAPGLARDFESDAPGRIAAGFTAEVGRWEVVRDDGGLVLAQLAESDGPTFNLALAEGAGRQDVDLSVRLRAVSGEVDQGGGLVWRARDARNYYVARYNPLEDNFRLYKVEDGVRTQLQGADVPGDAAWHVLRVTMVGPEITCYLDGKAHLKAEDATFPRAGRIGLWTKADARTYFDDLTVAE